MSEYRHLRDAVWARAWDGALSTPQLVVALRLVEHWPRIFPGEKTLARWTRLSERAVRDALHALEAGRLIQITRTPGRPNAYAFLDPQGGEIRVPSLGPTPAGAAAPPRQELPHPPAGAAAPTPAGAAAEADPDLKQSSKQEEKAGSARELMPHEKAELRKALEPPTGARPVGLYQFREAWKPPVRLRQLGLRELGLTDAEMVDRLKHCRLKLYERPFPSEEAQFERELRWLAEDKKTKAFREQRKANPHGLDENPGARRRPGDTPPTPVFGRRGAG